MNQAESEALLYSFPGAATENGTRSWGLTRRKFPSHSCGGYKSKVTEPAGLVSSEAALRGLRTAAARCGPARSSSSVCLRPDRLFSRGLESGRMAAHARGLVSTSLSFGRPCLPKSHPDAHTRDPRHRHLLLPRTRGGACAPRCSREHGAVGPSQQKGQRCLALRAGPRADIKQISRVI